MHASTLTSALLNAVSWSAFFLIFPRCLRVMLRAVHRTVLSKLAGVTPPALCGSARAIVGSFRRYMYTILAFSEIHQTLLGFAPSHLWSSLTHTALLQHDDKREEPCSSCRRCTRQLQVQCKSIDTCRCCDRATKSMGRWTSKVVPVLWRSLLVLDHEWRVFHSTPMIALLIYVQASMVRSWVLSTPFRSSSHIMV